MILLLALFVPPTKVWGNKYLLLLGMHEGPNFEKIDYLREPVYFCIWLLRI
jgi:hypothetical protein